MTSRAEVRVLLALALLSILVAVGCGGRRHRSKTEAEVLPVEALYDKALEELGQGHLRRARAHLDRIQFTVDNRPVLEPLVRLAIADATFHAGDDLSLIDARGKYLDFVTFYGDHPKAPYAQLQAGVCSLKQARHPARDQSQTRVAIGDLREVERRWPVSPYVRATRDMLERAEGSLAEHEFIVGRFYFQKNAYPSAIGRFRQILDAYPRYPGKEKLYYYLGQALLHTNNAPEARVYLDKLVMDYPNGRYAEEARKIMAQEPPTSGGANGSL